MKSLVYPTATLAGTIVGVGLFSLPFIASRTGYLVVFVYFIALTFIVASVHRIFAQLCLATPDKKRLPGFAKFHLGEWAKRVSMFSVIFGLLGAILAYLIVGGEFLNSLFSPVFGGSEPVYTFVYFALGAALIFFGIKLIAKIELWSLVLFFLILLVIFFKGNNYIDTSHFFAVAKNLKTSDFFLPYGPILFSLWGAALIPEVEEMMKGNKKKLKKVVVASTVIPVVIYAFFIYLVWGITGPMTTESALTGLKDYLGDGIVNAALFLGFLTTFTSFIALGLTLKKILWYDFGLSERLSWFLTCFVPLGLFALGFKSFIGVISLVGAVALGVDGTLILLMHRKLMKKKKRSTALVFPLILVFVFGIIYELIYFLK